MDTPEELGERGARMWAESTAEWRLSSAHMELLLEACRMADRLERLQGMLATMPDSFATIGPVLAEARQHSLALGRLLTEVRQGAKPKTGGVGKQVAGVSDLTKRIADRRGAAPG